MVCRFLGWQPQILARSRFSALTVRHFLPCHLCHVKRPANFGSGNWAVSKRKKRDERTDSLFSIVAHLPKPGCRARSPSPVVIRWAVAQCFVIVYLSVRLLFRKCYSAQKIRGVERNIQGLLGQCILATLALLGNSATLNLQLADTIIPETVRIQPSAAGPFVT